MKRRRHLLSISQLTSQLSNKRKKCVEARNKISGYAKTAADESSKAAKAAKAATRARQESARQRKMSEQQRHQKLANDALNNQASWQKKLSALESDVAKIEKKLDDAHIAESKKIAKETSRKIGAIEPVINVNAPLVDGDNYGNVAVGNNVTQSQTIIGSSNEFEGLKDLLRDIVDRLDDLELTDIDKCDLRESVEEALNELQSEEPEPGRVHMAIRLIKRILTPIGSAAITGAATGTDTLVQQWITQLGQFC